MKKQTAILFYVLSAYVVLQFGWWGFHLIELTTEIAGSSRRIVMIIGEGLVFFLILLFGLWQIRRSIRKELELSARQNNFILSVTHELKTPLASNKLYLQTLQKRQLDEDKRSELLSKAIDENKRLEMMIDNILYASRIENRKFQLHKEIINLTVLLEHLASQLSSNMDLPKVEIKAEENCFIEADPFMLEIILNNLIENAIKYGDKKTIELFCANTDNSSQFGVRNTGVPIPKDHLARIFDKFYRIQNEETRSSKGTGLGLYIVAQFVELHKGTIKLTSDTAGTSILINFPGNRK